MSLAPALPHWFDLLTIAVLVFGIWSGRKRGMSEELLPVIKWITIVFVCAAFYRELGTKFSNWTKTQPNTGFVLAYIGIGVGIHFAFGYVRRAIGEKMVGSDFFGRWEYYFGMMAGSIRCGCILLCSMALLNAAYVTDKELAERAKFQRDNFGSISFPTPGQMQRQVFYQSKTGTTIKVKLSNVLIVSAPPVAHKQEKSTWGARRDIDDVMGTGKR